MLDAEPVDAYRENPLERAARFYARNRPLILLLLTYAVVRPPVHGELQGAPPTLTYVPAGNYHGSDSFEFTVADAAETSASATVDITIQSVNDAPTAIPGTTALDEDATAALALSGTDVDGDALSFRVVVAPAHGVLAGSGANPSYTPAPNYFGSDSLTFVASDGQVDSAAATLAPSPVTSGSRTRRNVAPSIRRGARGAVGSSIAVH